MHRSLGYRGALADCVLWLLIRVQTHIFASKTYDRVQRVVQQEEEQEAAEVVAEVRSRSECLHVCVLVVCSATPWANEGGCCPTLQQWPGHAFPPSMPPLQLAASTAKHAAAALAESRQRAAREQRMARLKVRQGCWAGGNTSMHSRSSAHACSKHTPASKLALPCRLFPPGDWP